MGAKSPWVLLLPFLVAMPGVGQAPRLELHIKDVVAVPNAYAQVTVGHSRCDSNGDVFFVSYQPGHPNTVTRIRADGREVSSVSLSSVPELSSSALQDFAVAPDGTVYVLAYKAAPSLPGEILVVRFDKDGSQPATTRLEAPGLFPTQLAVFSSGELFVAGRQEETDSHESRHTVPFAGVFNERGQLVRKVELVGDIQPASPDTPDKDKSKAMNAEDYEGALDLTMAEAGPDGNIYLTRPTPEGPVFAVSPAGSVVRTIHLVPPAPNLQLTDVKVAAGRIAAAYEGEPPSGGTSPVTIVVLDTGTGEKVVEYFHQSYEIGVALACYTPDVFTFNSSDATGKRQIVHAAPR